MRRYGVDTLDAKDGLRRELARFQYPSKIDPDITANRVERKVSVSDAQHKALSELDGHMANARIARMQGKVDVSAVKAISPSSFEGVPPAEHEAIARDLQANLGILKQTAVRRLLDAHPESAKVGDVLKVAAERKGKQGVVFAHSLEAVEAIKSRLASEGFRVGTITGKDSAKDKAKRIGEFRPASGAAAIDVMVCSDAGATGANLQSGQWLVNYDTPDTAKTHAQRNGRINRIGQTQDVDLIDLVSDHPEERRRRDRLEKKYALREMMTTPMESLDDTGLAYFLRQRQIMRDNGAPR
jgi:ERCC4-related helicase